MQDACEVTLLLLHAVPSVIRTWHSVEVEEKKKKTRLFQCVFFTKEAFQ